MKLTLEKPVYGGDCLARRDGSGTEAGKAVFVPLTLPGETVVAAIVEEKRSFARAEVEQIVSASPDRVAPSCSHFRVCGGCHYQHADYPTQLALKQQILRETLERSGVVYPHEFGMLAAEPWAYRNRIRVAFTREGNFGYRGRRSHAIVPINRHDIAECPIAAPGLLLAAKQIAAFLQQSSGPVPISELELFTNVDESALLVTLFCESRPAHDPQPWLSALHAGLGHPAVGLRLQLADGSLNPPILSACGEASISYGAADFAYRVDHGAFFQVNRWLIDRFVKLVTEDHAGKLAWDLFAGVGLFARQLAASYAEVVAVESAPASQAALRHNLEGAKARAVSSTTLDFLRRNREEREARPDLIVLDPPRAGLGDETTTLLNAIHAPEMVYVSCDPATLARDLHALTRERYRIEKITMVDMFPQTFHLETVVHLRKA